MLMGRPRQAGKWWGVKPTAYSLGTKLCWGTVNLALLPSPFLSPTAIDNFPRQVPVGLRTAGSRLQTNGLFPLFEKGATNFWGHNLCPTAL